MLNTNTKVHPCSEDIYGSNRSLAAEMAKERWNQRQAWTKALGSSGVMPSKKLSNISNTLKLKNTNMKDVLLLEELANVNTMDRNDVKHESEVDIIVKEFESDNKLMNDSIEAEILRIEALRNLPQPLTIKRNVRAKLSASVTLKSKHKPLSFRKRMKYAYSIQTRKLSEHIKNSIYSVELWYEAIRTVEGNYGSAIASYFYFLRRLFVMNFIISMFIIFFIIVPQVMYYDQDANDGTAVNPEMTKFYRNGSNGFVDFLSGETVSDYIDIMNKNKSSINTTRPNYNQLMQTNAGMFKNTVMFYGYYYSGIINVTGSSYNMPYAYFFTMSTIYLLCFVILCYKTALSYRRNFIETASDGLSNIFANKLFCGWDFGISSEQAAQLNSRSIYNELKELITEQNQVKPKLNWLRKLIRIVYQSFTNLIVLALLGMTCYSVYWLLRTRYNLTIENWPLVLATLITSLIIIFPFIFGQFIKWECYTPRQRFFLTLIRMFAMNIALLTLLLLFWYRRDEDCWETSLGQEAYRLIIMDFFFSIILIPIFEFVRGAIFRYCTVFGAPNFDIATSSMSLIYTQSIIWIGLWFSPVVCIVATIKLFISFYIRRASLFRPSKRPWRAAQTQTIMLLFVLISLICALVFFSFIMFRNSSRSCGPFQNYDYVYSVVTIDLLQLDKNERLAWILSIAFRPGVIALILIALCARVYYMRAKAKAHGTMVNLLRDMLTMEGKDKQFLLKAISKVVNGEWQYSARSDEHNTSNMGHTWKYVNNENVRKPTNYGYHLEINESRTPPTTPMFVKPRPFSYMEGELLDKPRTSYRSDESSGSFKSGCQGQSNEQFNEVKKIK